jgi:RNA polymerase sigma-70 factor (ECF subfamily)
MTTAEELATMIQDHRSMFLRVAKRYLPSTLDPEDAVQVASINAMHGLKDFRGDSQLSSWFTRIVINTAMMQRRAAKETASFDEPVGDNVTIADILASPEPLASASYERSQHLGIVMNALDGLKPKRRATMSLRFRDGLSIKQIAKRQHVSIGTVKSALFHATRELRERLAV